MATPTLVAAPAHGFVWCPNAKVATTTWYEIFRRRLLPRARTMPRCFRHACPSSAAQQQSAGVYPLALASKLPDKARLCDRNRFVSFTFVRNPWDRLASAYRSKIERGDKVRDRQALAVQARIRERYGLRRGRPISFGHFVRWVVQQNASAMNTHWMPHSVRCSPLHTPYDYIGRFETLQEDIALVLDTLLGWSPGLLPDAHWSSSRTAANRTAQLLQYYDSPELVELVARKYRDDIVPFGYTFPGRAPDAAEARAADYGVLAHRRACTPFEEGGWPLDENRTRMLVECRSIKGLSKLWGMLPRR